MKVQRRTLVIGLGGTGTYTVKNLLSQMRNAGVIDGYSGEVENGEPIRFLTFDTDSSFRSGAKYADHEESLRYHFVQLDQLKVERKVRDLDASPNKNYRSWMPDKVGALIKARDARHGAGQWRLLGRLAYVEEQKLIERKIEQAYNELRTYNCDGLDVEDIDVYIVSSLAGGTGSGLLLDIAYYLQRFFVERDSNLRTNTFAYLLMPDVFGDVETGGRTEANTYAALKEINAFYLQQKDFHMEYPIGGNVHIPKGKAIPFSSVFLFDRELAACSFLPNAEQCFKYMATVMYLRLVSPVGRAARSVFANVKVPPYGSDDLLDHSIEGAGYVYSACSGAILDFPSNNDVKDYIGKRVKALVLDQLERSSSSVNELPENDLEELTTFLESKKMYEEKNYAHKLVQGFNNEDVQELAKRLGAVLKKDDKGFQAEMADLLERIIKLDVAAIERETKEAFIKTDYEGSIKDYWMDLRPKQLAEEQWLEMQSRWEAAYANTDVLSTWKIKEKILSVVKNLVDDPILKDIQRQTYAASSKISDNLFVLLEQFKEAQEWIRELKKKHDDIKGFHFKGLKKDLIARFNEQNTAGLINELSKVKRELNVANNYYFGLRNRVATILKEQYLLPYQKRLEEELETLEKNRTGIDKFKRELSKKVGPDWVEGNEIKQDGGLNEFKVDLKGIIDGHAADLKVLVDDYWKSVQSKLELMVTEANDQGDNNAFGNDGEPDIDLGLDNLLEKRLAELTDDDTLRKWMQGYEYMNDVYKSIAASNIKVFTNLETHSMSVGKLFLLMPSEYVDTYFNEDRSTRTDNETKIKQYIEEKHKDANVELKHWNDNRMVVYFETHHHPAHNIKGIRRYEVAYEDMPFDPSLLHIHKEYVNLPNLVYKVISSTTHFCGNAGCGYDISEVPRSVKFCPGCNNAILNRCGNEGCNENNLLKLIGGLENYADHDVCPTCHGHIRSFKWYCDKGHGWQLRTDDPFCTKCTQLAKEGKIGFDDRACMNDAERYYMECLGCKTKKKAEPFVIPLPEYMMGVPPEKVAYLKSELLKAGVGNNSCNECGSKLYPESPASTEGDLRFMPQVTLGHSVCSGHNSGQTMMSDHRSCYHCGYVVKFGENDHDVECPRCRRELHRCNHCTDTKGFVIDNISLAKNHGDCPVCNYKIGSNENKE